MTISWSRIVTLTMNIHTSFQTFWGEWQSSFANLTACTATSVRLRLSLTLPIHLITEAKQNKMLENSSRREYSSSVTPWEQVRTQKRETRKHVSYQFGCEGGCKATTVSLQDKSATLLFLPALPRPALPFFLRFPASTLHCQSNIPPILALLLQFPHFQSMQSES